MIVVLTGENDFALRQALHQMIASYTAKHSADGVVRRDGAELSKADLPQLFQGVSLFSPTSCIVLTDASQNKEVWEALPELLTTGDSTVVLVEPKADKRTKTYKWLQKNSDIRSFSLLKDVQLQQWLEETAHSLDLSLSPDVARYLIGYSGTDQWRLYREVQKLALTKRPVTQQLIQEIIDQHPQASAFDVLDAAIAGRKDAVHQLVSTLSVDEDPYRFVGLLTSQVYALAVCYAADGRSSAVVAKDAGLHPYVASKTLATAQKLTGEHMRLIVRTLAKLDIALKTSGASPWLLVQSSLMKIATR